MKNILSLLFIALCSICYSQDVERERPKEWDGIIEGGRFQDRFLPMRGEVLSSDVWGADDVRPRLIDNGIEDETFSYWGGNIIEQDGKYHMFACAWLEDSPKGHMTWSKSVICHTVSDNLYGAYKNKELIAFGHNPELYRAKNGEYIIAAHTNWQPFYLHSKTLNGAWKQEPFLMDDRGRGLIEGVTNLTFASREDGSVLMVCRGGGVWVSRDGKETFKQISTESVYPKREGRFEDPVIWRDNVQYHLIVNDWLGRVAYYMRSADGVNWVEDCGEAYTPGVAYHEDGRVENWYKFERIKVFQDEHKRAIQANFAVCDTLKKEDRGNDTHSSKNITIPLNKGVLMEIVDTEITPKMRKTTVLVKGEDDFKPSEELDIKSLRFGLSSDINYGRGCKVKSIETKGNDLLITFNTSGYTIPDSEFAPKMMGRDKKGELIYGYARNPNVDFEPAIISCTKPIQKGENIAITVENFGFKTSPKSTLTIKVNGKIGKCQLGEIKPYEKQEVELENITVGAEGYATIDITDNQTNKVISHEDIYLEQRVDKRKIK